MSPAANRLPLRKLPSFFETAQRAQNRHFRVFANKTDNQFRFAVITPKKQFARAVDRNQMRRRVTAVLQTDTQNLSGWDAAVVVSQSAAALSAKELEAAIKQVFQKLQNQALKNES